MAQKKSAPRTAFSEAANIASEDWRLQAVTTLSEPAVLNGKAFESGARVKAVALVEYDDKTTLQYGLPSTPALMLDFAREMYAQCSDMLPAFAGQDKNGIHQAHDDAAIISLLEKRMAVVIFSFTALEAFCNEVIARAYDRGFVY
jgi:hypothetical protein